MHGILCSGIPCLSSIEVLCSILVLFAVGDDMERPRPRALSEFCASRSELAAYVDGVDDDGLSEVGRMVLLGDGAGCDGPAAGVGSCTLAAAGASTPYFASIYWRTRSIRLSSLVERST